MLNNINKNVHKNNGFSLIEILQTVILVGIIAGLSVSFFKKVNTDDKLMMSTTLLVKSAIEEANVQMCSDETPYCNYGGGGFSPLNNNETPTQACQRYYGNNNNIYFDEKLGYCVITTANAANIPPIIDFAQIGKNIVKNADGTYTYTYKQKDGEVETDVPVTITIIKDEKNVPTSVSYTSAIEGATTKIFKDSTNNSVNINFDNLIMQKTTNLNGTEIYYAPLPCVNTNNMTYYGSSVALHDVTCANNTPVWDAKIDRNVECFTSDAGTTYCPNDSSGSYMVSEICYRLWDLINHKEQIVSEHSDLYMTCVESNPCINTQDCNANDDPTNQANLILPSGARIYNLSCMANTDCTAAGATNSRNVDHQHIFIKADRVPDDRTFNFTSSSTGVINAVKWFNNNIYDTSTNSFKDDDDNAGNGNANQTKYDKTLTCTAQTYTKVTKDEETGTETKETGQSRKGYTVTSGGSLYNSYMQSLFSVDKDGKVTTKTTTSTNSGTTTNGSTNTTQSTH